jgi:hypothetical protein
MTLYSTRCRSCGSLFTSIDPDDATCAGCEGPHSTLADALDAFQEACDI